ncbi:hypothetical protein JNB_02215 [Janibacter sp. HTCC2649]|nr:hypothetical protein JNB_02215 [Janibacter sp. HTCC2649]
MNDRLFVSFMVLLRSGAAETFGSAAGPGGSNGMLARAVTHLTFGADGDPDGPICTSVQEV